MSTGRNLIHVLRTAVATLVLLGLFSTTGCHVGAPPIVSQAKYQQVQNAMSYSEVVQIIGNPGQEISRNRIEGVPGVMPSIETVMYQWVNANGSNMNAMFQNDKLMQKAQFGLQ